MNSKVPQGKLNSLDNKKPPTLPTESKKELEKTEEENEEGEEEEEEDPIKERPKEEEKEKLEISDIQDNDKERRKSLPNEEAPEKVLVEVKPRMNYLRKKMETMNIGQNVFNAVSSNLFSSLRSIKKDVFSDNVKILQTSKSMNNISVPEEEPKKNVKIDKTRMKMIKELKKDEAYLKNNLFALTNNENLLKNASFLSLSGKTTNSIDSVILKNKLKDIAKTKERIAERISEINTRINILLYKESKDEGISKASAKDNVQKFIDNFQKEKEEYNNKLNSIQKESEMRKQKMLKDIENKLNEKTKELQSQEQEKENQKQKYLLQLREEEKEKIDLRTKTNNQKLMRVKVYINEKYPKKKYSYIEHAKKYIIKEDNLVLNENKKRKMYMKHINREELDQFGKKIDNIKAKAEEDQIEKSKELKKMWNERVNLIPTYVPPILKECEKEKLEKIREEKKKMEMIASNHSMKIEYAKTKIPKPKKIVHSSSDVIDDSLMKKSHSMNGGISVKNNLNSLKPMKKYKKIEKKEITQNDKDNFSIQPFLVKKPKILRRTVDIKKIEKAQKPIDYLTIERINRSNRRRNKSSMSHESTSRNMQDINKIFNEHIGSIDENIYLAKNKVAVIENQAKQKEELLKLSGGVSVNPELGSEVCDLMIDSIKAKLSILDKINN